MKRALFLLGLCLPLAACHRDSAPGEPDGAPEESPAEIPNPHGAWAWKAANAGGFWCGWRTDTHPLGSEDSFPIEIRIAQTQAGDPIPVPLEKIAIEARMPDHDHGMLQRVELHTESPGHYRVEGMRLHMGGYWELYVDVTQGAWTERVQFEITL